MSNEEQMNIAKATLINCLPLRAFIYGQDYIKAITYKYSKVSNARMLKNEVEFANFTQAVNSEKVHNPGANLETTQS